MIVLAKPGIEVFNKSMSEYVPPSNEADIFRDLISPAYIRDKGIEHIDNRMEQLENELLSVFMGQPRSSEIQSALDEARILFADAWEHTNEITRVSGCLRLYGVERRIDEDDIHRLISTIATNDLDGETIRFGADERPYFTVDQAELVSKGPVVLSVYDETDALRDVMVGYVFSRLDDTSGVEFFARPNDLMQHTYDTPTIMEVTHGLEREYPEQYAVLQRLLAPGLTSELPNILTGIEGSMQELLLADVRFRSFVEVYCAHVLQLRARQPYTVTVEKEIQCFDFAKKLNGDWQELEIDSPLSVEVSEINILFARTKEDEVRAQMFAETYNQEFGYHPEMVGFDMRNVTAFYSRQPSMSLLSRAIEAGFIEEGEGDATQGRIAIKDKQAEVNENIEVLRQLKQALKEVAEKVDVYRRYPLRTHKEAKEASRQMIDLLADVKCADGSFAFLMSPNVEAYGREVCVALPLADQSGDEGAEIRPLYLGESVKGPMKGVYALVDEVYGEDGETMFVPQPTLQLHVASQEDVGERLQYESIDLAVTMTNYWSAVPLRGDVDVNLIDLDEYEAREKAFQSIKTAYVDLAVVDTLESLDEQLFNERPNDYTSLDVNIFTQIDSAVRELSDKGIPLSPMLGFLEMAMLNRRVIVKVEGDDGLQVGNIIDVTNNDSLAITLHNGKQDEEFEVWSVPIAAIKEFKY
jgi:hypothetical protein